MAKLLKHLGIGGSTKKLPTPTESVGTESTSGDKHGPDGYGTLVDNRTAAGGCVNPNKDEQSQDYEAQTLPISGNTRRQKGSGSTGGTGGGIRDWSLRAPRPVKHSTLTSSLKEKGSTLTSKGKTVGRGGELDSGLMLQRSTTGEFTDESQTSIADNGIQSLLSEYSNPFDLRSPTSPDSGAETVSDSGPEMTEEQLVCQSRVGENENDYSVPYEHINKCNLQAAVANIKINTAVLTTDNLVHDHSLPSQDAFSVTAKPNVNFTSNIIVPPQSDTTSKSSSSVSMVHLIPHSNASIPVVETFHSAKDDLSTASVTKEQPLVPTHESSVDLISPGYNVPQATDLKVNNDASRNINCDEDSVKPKVLTIHDNTIIKNKTAMYDDPYEDEALFDLARQSLLKQQLDQSQQLPPPPQVNQLPLGYAQHGQSPVDETNPDTLMRNMQGAERFVPRNPCDDGGLPKSVVSEGIYSEFMTARSCFDARNSHQRECSGGGDAMYFNDQKMNSMQLDHRINNQTGTEGYNEGESLKSTGDVGRLHGVSAVSNAGGSFKGGGILKRDVVREGSGVEMKASVEQGAAANETRTSRPVPQHMRSPTKDITSDSPVSTCDLPVYAKAGRNVEGSSGSVISSPSVTKVKQGVLSPQLSVHDPARHGREPVLSGLQPAKFYKLSSVYSGVNDDDDEENDENYMDLQDDAVPFAIPGGRQPPHRSGSLRLGSATPPPGGLCAPHTGVSDLTPGNYEEPWDLRVTQKTLTGRFNEATGRTQLKDNTSKEEDPINRQCCSPSCAKGEPCTNPACYRNQSGGTQQVYAQPWDERHRGGSSSVKVTGRRGDREDAAARQQAYSVVDKNEIQQQISTFDSRPGQDYEVPWDQRARDLERDFAKKGGGQQGCSAGGEEGGRMPAVMGRREQVMMESSGMRGGGSSDEWRVGWSSQAGGMDRLGGGANTGAIQEDIWSRGGGQHSMQHYVGGMDPNGRRNMPTRTSSQRSRDHYRPLNSELELARPFDHNNAFVWSESGSMRSSVGRPGVDTASSLSMSASLTLGERIDPRVPLEQQNWYHGAIGRLDAEMLLRSFREGSYLVRNSESNRRDFSLSVKSARGFMHMKIVANSCGRYILGQFSQPFYNIPQMVYHYTINKLPIKGAEHMSLMYPVSNELL